VVIRREGRGGGEKSGRVFRELVKGKEQKGVARYRRTKKEKRFVRTSNGIKGGKGGLFRGLGGERRRSSMN